MLARAGVRCAVIESRPALPLPEERPGAASLPAGDSAFTRVARLLRTVGRKARLG